MDSSTFHLNDVHTFTPNPLFPSANPHMMSDTPRHICKPELLTWTHLPNMGITAETGSNYNADDDELPQYDDVDQGQRVEHRKLRPPQVEGSVDMVDLETDGNVSSPANPLKIRIIRPASAFNLDASTSNSTLDDGGQAPMSSPSNADVGAVAPANGFKIKIPPFSKRVSGILPKSQTLNHSNQSYSESDGDLPSLIAHPRFSAFPESVSSNPYINQHRPQLARKINVFHDSHGVTMEQFETFTHAHVSPVVFGKRKFVDLQQRPDILAMNLEMLRNAEGQSNIPDFTEISQRHHASGDAAIPTISRAAQRKQLFKDIFGVERVQVPIYSPFTASRIGKSSSGSDESRLYYSIGSDLPTTSDEMTSDSDVPTRGNLSRSIHRFKPYARGLKRRLSPPSSSTTLYVDSTEPVEERTYSADEDGLYESQRQHSTGEALLDGHVASEEASNDDINVTIELRPPTPTNELALPTSPTVQQPIVIPLSPSKDVVELVSPMVMELRNLAPNSPPPTQPMPTGLTFTLNPDSALAMPNVPPKESTSSFSLFSLSNHVQDILNPPEDLSWGAGVASTSSSQYDGLPDIPLADQLPTHSPENSFIDLPDESGAAPASVPTAVLDISDIEEEEGLVHGHHSTVFDPAYRTIRSQNRWAQDKSAWVANNVVIGEIWEQYVNNGRIHIFVQESNVKEEEEEEEEEEFDELESDSDTGDYRDSDFSASPSKRAKGFRVIRKRENISFSQRDEPTATAPRFLARQIETWSVALRSLVKGKKRFLERDLLEMKEALQGIYDNHRHIAPTSSVAGTVFAIMALPAKEIPGEDAIGLRPLARKAARAWGIRTFKPRSEHP
ncbi:hypothetical protein JR316_0005184 [Psilocybe cubensis]|uniref:Uncharacterized protein n=2 Tax=Psilocybe cubensis TaxID=181762 RepID=A0ACB8H5G5_PSICU|nr:hypothetical protein JR316_0005184 [Psilocybe cubensis]KAH9483084.1 hypothetical protein JR316_0005184 [Psilocybe cubensis]